VSGAEGTRPRIDPKTWSGSEEAPSLFASTRELREGARLNGGELVIVSGEVGGLPASGIESNGTVKLQSERSQHSEHIGAKIGLLMLYLLKRGCS